MPTHASRSLRNSCTLADHHNLLKPGSAEAATLQLSTRLWNRVDLRIKYGTLMFISGKEPTQWQTGWWQTPHTFLGRLDPRSREGLSQFFTCFSNSTLVVRPGIRYSIVPQCPVCAKNGVKRGNQGYEKKEWKTSLLRVEGRERGKRILGLLI